MDVFNKSISFANKAYGNISRKGDGEPLILHAMEAAEIVATITSDRMVMVAAVLHDTVEDCGATIDEIKEQFGERVAELVGADTEDKRPELPPDQSWLLRKQDTINMLKTTKDRDVKILVLGDKLSNMRSMYRLCVTEGDKMWEHFNQKDPQKHYWYYKSISEALIELKDTTAWQEYDRLVELVFNKK